MCCRKRYRALAFLKLCLDYLITLECTIVTSSSPTLAILEAHISLIWSRRMGSPFSAFRRLWNQNPIMRYRKAQGVRFIGVMCQRQWQPPLMSSRMPGNRIYFFFPVLLGWNCLGKMRHKIFIISTYLNLVFELQGLSLTSFCKHFYSAVQVHLEGWMLGISKGQSGILRDG